jgi:hypothetical protein
MLQSRLRLIFWMLAVISVTLTGGPATAGHPETSRRVSSGEFQKLMHTVEDGWNEGDPQKAADGYAEDAIYTEPPDKQVHLGRRYVYEFFGGDAKPARAMSRTWHQLASDEGGPIGFGEDTFRGNHQYHGVVVVRIVDGKIQSWREYQYQSDLSWNQFAAKNSF